MNTPVSAPMDEPIQGFSDCHVDIIAMLDQFTSLATGRLPVADRAQTANTLLHFFEHAIAAHHREEESELFSAVAADAVDGEERKTASSLIDHLTAEHRQIEAAYAALAPMLIAIEGGADVRLDGSAVGALVSAYLAHARLEEEAFLPLAQRVLARNSDHMAALGLSLHIRRSSTEIRQKFGFI